MVESGVALLRSAESKSKALPFDSALTRFAQGDSSGWNASIYRGIGISPGAQADKKAALRMTMLGSSQ
jgi:hypothetical protein